MKRSAKDVVAISDALCIDHGLSVIREPQDKTVSYDRWQGNQKKFTHRDELRMIIDAALRMQPDGFDALMQLMEEAGCQIKRGAHISIKPPEGKRYIRLDTLGPEYDESTLHRTLAGEHAHIPKIPRGDFNESQVKRLVDIEAKLREGKGKGYQVWAERNNIDAKTQMIIFLKEHNIGSISELENQIHVLYECQTTVTWGEPSEIAVKGRVEIFRRRAGGRMRSGCTAGKYDPTLTGEKRSRMGVVR